MEDKQKYWDSVVSLYDEHIQLISYQPYVTLLTHTQAHKCKNILEVAMGTGTHTLYFAKTLMQRGANIVCTEISPKMVAMAEEKFRDPENEFCTFPYNKVHFRHDEDLLDGSVKLNLQEVREGKVTDERDRLVFGCISNNEFLPFPDNTFDCYIAALSLQLVHDYKKQLAEALRVV